jgi:hypothetical protein
LKLRDADVFWLLWGQRVTTLVAAHLQAGNYRVAFKAENLAAGPYFYRMQAGEFVQTKQMMLLK